MSTVNKQIRKIVVMGASSVFGQGDSEYGGFVGRLKRWHESKNDRYYVYNLGISGNTTENILNRMDVEIAARKPHLIIFSFGHNDSSREGKPEENPSKVYPDKFRENINEILKRAKKSAPNVMVLGVAPFDESRTKPITWADVYFLLYDAISYDNIVEEECAKLSIPYCNVMGSWLRRGYKDLLYKDGLHANSKGHEMIFETLKEFIVKTYNFEE